MSKTFEAVSQITTKCVLDLLQQFPDAKGTLHYLKYLQCTIEMYYRCIFGQRTSLKSFPFGKKFKSHGTQYFSSNSGTSGCCKARNTHTLLLIMPTLVLSSMVIVWWDKIPNGNKHFLPWLLGSQASKQANI